ncbi:MAG: peptidylprolyl isomerase [Dehalococcoidia bacterium]
MAKKHKRTMPEPAPTKRQLSKWQRQMKIRRIVIIAAVALLAGIVGGVVYGYYEDYRQRTAVLHEVVIKVNDASFTMDYYMKMLDAYTQDMEPDLVYYMAGMVANSIIDVEVMRQYARNELVIEITSEEIEARREQEGWADGEIYTDIVSSVLLQEKLEEYFDSQLPETMEQAHVRVMLVESKEVADEVIDQIKAGGNFTALVDEFSSQAQIEGDLGWLPSEIMPNTLIEEAAFNVTPGEISQPIHDEAAMKDIGYWLIELIDIAHDEDDEMEVEARAILLGSRAEAELVKAMLNGENFDYLAEQYSQHESKDDGGELGWLQRGDMKSEAFDEVAFNLALNLVSEPVKDESVKTSGGYWIVEVIDRDDERVLEGESREELMYKRWNDWFEEEKEKSTIENLLDEAKMWWAVGQVLLKR